MGKGERVRRFRTQPESVRVDVCEGVPKGRRCGQGSAPEGARQAGDGQRCRCVAGYGMSETGPLLSAAQLRSNDLSGDPDREVELRTRVGRAVPLVDLRIVDTNMKKLPHHGATSGEIVVRAP